MARTQLGTLLESDHLLVAWPLTRSTSSKPRGVAVMKASLTTTSDHGGKKESHGRTSKLPGSTLQGPYTTRSLGISFIGRRSRTESGNFTKCIKYK